MGFSAMRCALFSLYVFALSGAVQAQTALVCGAAEGEIYPANSGSVLGPGYARSYNVARPSAYSGLVTNRTYVPNGPWGQELRRANSVNNIYTGNIWYGRPIPRVSPPVHRAAAVYFYSPQYPGLSYESPQLVSPEPSILSAPLVTPHHDPFFEERIWETIEAGGDISDYWGW
jgi:hypothetical protein